MLATLLTAALLPVAAAAADSAPKKFVAPRTIPELEARIRKVLDSTHVPGMGLAIVRHDSVVYTGGIGLSRVSPARPATAATLFRIGSTSKAFVALTVMALVREGKLSLRDPLRKHLPDFYYVNPWEATDTLRLVHLLEHTSGFDDNSLKSYAHNDPTPITLERGLALDSATRVSRWRPGTRFSYCNTGPAIVARVIEVIEGKPFEQVVQERWFGPIGMATATYLFPDTARVAAATLYRDDGTTPVPYWHVFIRPAGSINAAATDMAAYVRFLLGRGTIDGKVLLPADALERMERTESGLMGRAGLTVGYGLHLYRTTDSTGFVWTGHNGGVEGGLSDLSYLPQHGVGYALQINAGNGGALRLLTQLVRGYVTQGLAPQAPPPRATVSAAVRARFTGWYRAASPRMQHVAFAERLLGVDHLTFTDTSLVLQPLLDDVSEMIPVDSLLYRGRGEPVATMALVSDPGNGASEGLENFGPRLGGSAVKVSAFNALGSAALAALWCLAALLSLAAALFGGVRWVVRRLRKRPTPRPAVATPWRWAMLATLFALLNVGLLIAASDDLLALGKLTAMSGGMHVAGVLFALASLAGVVIAVRGAAATTRWEKVSLATARVVLVMNLVAACYMTYWGYIGWRTWG